MKAFDDHPPLMVGLEWERSTPLGKMLFQVVGMEDIEENGTIFRNAYKIRRELHAGGRVGISLLWYSEDLGCFVKESLLTNGRRE